MRQPPTRATLPYSIANVADFGRHPKMLSPVALINQLKASPTVWHPLRDIVAGAACTSPCRPRIPGHWELLYLCFVVSNHADTKPWYDYVQDFPELFSECGFEQRPSYATVQRRFAELENYEEAFQSAVHRLVAHARKREPGIGSWLHVDSTEAETQGAHVHDCGPGDDCPTRRRRRLPKLTADQARALRQQLSELPSDEDEIGANLGGSQLVENGETQIVTWIDRRGVQHHGRRIRLGGHWWRSSDLTAGTRAYSRGGRTLKVWHGYYASSAIDHVTGRPVATRLYAADTNESKNYPDLLDRASDATGQAPLIVAGDKGFSISEVYEHNTRRNIASVFPWRSSGYELEPEHTLDYDMHGVPRCKHCGGSGDYVWSGLREKHNQSGATREIPAIRFRCAVPESTACLKVQEINPSRNWRRLLPLWRTHEAYVEMRTSHNQYERSHRQSRLRYRVGPNSYELRPKRIGIACQQLRATAALVADWLYLAAMHGWLGSDKLADRRPYSQDHQRSRIVKAMRRKRARAGLVGGGYARGTPRSP